MTKCDFCKRYNPGFGGEEASCDGWAGSSYCEEAIEKMTEVLKSGVKVNSKPSKPGHRPSDEDIKWFMNEFFGI